MRIVIFAEPQKGIPHLQKKLNSIIFKNTKSAYNIINFQFFLRSHGVTPRIREIIECFKAVDKEKDASVHLKSNDMLALVRPHLLPFIYFFLNLYSILYFINCCPLLHKFRVLYKNTKIF